MPFKKILRIAIAVLVLTLALIIKCNTDKVGWPIIKTKIDSQMADLAAQTGNFGGYPVGRREQVKFFSGDHPYSGRIWYETQVNGGTGDLVVDWDGYSNACQIDVISVQSANLSPKIVWQRQTNSNLANTACASVVCWDKIKKRSSSGLQSGRCVK